MENVNGNIEQLLTVKQVAQWLNCSCNTVRYTLAGNKIPYVLVGSNKRFKKESIEKFINNNTTYYTKRKNIEFRTRW